MTICVTDVTKAGWEYDPDLNRDDLVRYTGCRRTHTPTLHQTLGTDSKAALAAGAKFRNDQQITKGDGPPGPSPFEMVGIAQHPLDIPRNHGALDCGLEAVAGARVALASLRIT